VSAEPRDGCYPIPADEDPQPRSVHVSVLIAETDTYRSTNRELNAQEPSSESRWNAAGSPPFRESDIAVEPVSGPQHRIIGAGPAFNVGDTVT